MNRKPGRVCIALAALLQKSFHESSGLKLTWEAEQVYPAAVAWAASFAAGAAVALRAAKKAIDEGLELDLDSALRLESTLFAGLFATEDRAIGMASFVENGPGKARFTGR